jgi:hypothetical protein
MKALRYICWFFCLVCSAALLSLIVWVIGYDFYARQGFWGVVGFVALVVVIVFGSYPVAHWKYRPWKKEDRQP